MRYLIISSIISLTFMMSQDRIKCGLEEGQNQTVLHRTDPPENQTHYQSPLGIFYIHYDTTTVNGWDHQPLPGDENNNGIPDFVETTADMADSTYSVLVDRMGYDVQPPDEDGIYDIYIRDDLNPSWYGVTYWNDNLNNGSSWIVIDNDFSPEEGFYTTGYDAMKITVPHEFFHAIQLGYSGFTWGNVYLYEMSSTWIEDVIAPEVNDYLSLRYNFYSYPNRSIFSTSGYSIALYAHYLTLVTEGVEDELDSVILRTIWNNFRAASHHNAFTSIEDVLVTTWNTIFIDTWLDWVTLNLYNNIDENFYYHEDQGLIGPITTSPMPLLEEDQFSLNTDNHSAAIQSYLIITSDVQFEISLESDNLSGYVAIESNSPERNIIYSANEIIVTDTLQPGDRIHVILGVQESDLGSVEGNIQIYLDLDPPLNLVAESLEYPADYIQLSWDASDGEDLIEYLIYRDGEFFTSITETSYYDVETEHDVEYCYTVSALYDIGESDQSNEACAMWQLCPPSSLAAIAGDEEVFITWDGISCDGEPWLPPSLVFYSLYRDGELLADLDQWTLEYTDSPVENLTEYCYTMSATYTEGDSPMTDPVCAIPFQIEPPEINNIASGDDEIYFDWTWQAPPLSVAEVNLSIVSFEDNQIAIYMENIVGIPGYTLTLDSDIEGYVLNNAYGGSSGGPGFLIVSNPDGMISLFSTGLVIPAGEGILVYADVTISGNEGCFSLSSQSFSGPNGEDLSVDTGPLFCISPDGIEGCTDPDALNYDFDATIDDESCNYPNFNIYRDNQQIESLENLYSYSDMGLLLDETHCYTVTASVEDENESFHSNEACASTIAECELEMYSDLPNLTGEFSTIVIEDVLGIDVGECDEIGVFDANGIIDMGSGMPEIGELLVGSSLWAEEQISIYAIGSLEFGWYDHFPGYVEGNPIIFKYWSASEGMEYAVEAEYSAGSGDFGWLNTTAVLHIVTGVNQSITLNPYMNNLMSTYIQADDMSPEAIFGDDVIIVGNDQGQFYVPEFNINTIEEISNLEGYRCYFANDEPLTINIHGFQVPHDTSFLINPNINNLIPYHVDSEMSSQYAFDSIVDDILIISSDNGELIIPELSIWSLGSLVPGEAYRLFLSGENTIEFSYPLPQLANLSFNIWEELKPAMISQHYGVVKTGNVHPIVITDIRGDVQIGDEIAVYADGEIVGATRIASLDLPIPITAWGEIKQDGVDIPGFTIGDKIEFRIWSIEQNKELRITANLDGEYFGETPLTTGSIIVHIQDLIPTEFSLSSAYPNPFNPVTTFDYAIPYDAYVVIKAFDVRGKEVAELVNGMIEEGIHEVVWDASKLSSGMYFVRMTSGDFKAVMKIIFLK